MDIRDIAELGAYGVILVLFIWDRVKYQPDLMESHRKALEALSTKYDASLLALSDTFREQIQIVRDEMKAEREVFRETITRMTDGRFSP